MQIHMKFFTGLKVKKKIIYLLEKANSAEGLGFGLLETCFLSLA